ncbi:hypothetical protein NBO_1088g0001 [Nosema bombycis CQ1]|uniref:Uncharacterized protein n=2 Tax=Nosema bombycis TaxID=27978 RepID=R0M0I2_NOSB1|nr:unknown [Nosema bombycis]EOB11534.1 hypothetical protein NBO_1088g0001 [Nosema bombycis CQ1]|eukprot:EOB11534.1 hypothetical protein NBO_1088g0001 [Nosema bombycis CQ1]
MKSVLKISCFNINSLSLCFYCLLVSIFCCEFFDNTTSENLLDFVSDNGEETTYMMSDNNYFDHSDKTMFDSEFNLPLLTFEDSCLTEEDSVKSNDVTEKEDINSLYDKKSNMISDKNYFDQNDITMFDSDFNFPLLTFEHSCLADDDSVKSNDVTVEEDINALCDKQNNLINKIMTLFNEDREDDEWSNLNEILDLKFLLESFLSLTIKIRSKMLRSFKKYLDIYDENMKLTLKSTQFILKIKSEIKNDLIRKKSNLFIFACLKREMKNMNKFYFEVNATYKHCKIKRIEILKNISNLKKSFDVAIDFIKSFSNLFELETLAFVKETLLIVFYMFDKDQKGSIYEIDDLIKKTIAISLGKFYEINDLLYSFINTKH